MRSSAVLRAWSTRGVSVRTTMPSRAGVEHEATRASCPSTPTTQTRQDPMAPAPLR